MLTDYLTLALSTLGPACKGPFTSSDCDVAATSLRNLLYCFGVVLLHPVSVMSQRRCSQMALQPIWVQCHSDVADAVTSLDVKGSNEYNDAKLRKRK